MPSFFVILVLALPSQWLSPQVHRHTLVVHPHGTFPHWTTQHLAIRLQSGHGTIVGVHVDRHQWICKWIQTLHWLVRASLYGQWYVFPTQYMIPRNTPVFSVQGHPGYPCVHVYGQVARQGVSQNPVGPAWRPTAVVHWTGDILISTTCI